MASYSEFVIIRADNKNKKIVTDEQVLAAYKYSSFNVTDDTDVFYKKVDPKDIPPYIQSGRLTYINHFDKEEYNELLSVEFNSLFSCLKDEFNLSSYSVNNTLEISACEAEKMLEAINYLLFEKYDHLLEEAVLNNHYIKVFGETFTPYVNYYIKLNHTNNNIEDEEDNYELFSYNEEYQSELCILKRVKSILDTFLLLVNENTWREFKYVLLYIVS